MLTSCLLCANRSMTKEHRPALGDEVGNRFSDSHGNSTNHFATAHTSMSSAIDGIVLVFHRSVAERRVIDRLH